jgi:hypothetical protein
VYFGFSNSQQGCSLMLQTVYVFHDAPFKLVLL